LLMIQAFRGDFWVTTEFSGAPKSTGAMASREFQGCPAVAGLRRRAILSGLKGSGHPQADGRGISVQKNRIYPGMMASFRPA